MSDLPRTKTQNNNRNSNNKHFFNKKLSQSRLKPFIDKDGTNDSATTTVRVKDRNNGKVSLVNTTTLIQQNTTNTPAITTQMFNSINNTNNHKNNKDNQQHSINTDLETSSTSTKTTPIITKTKPDEDEGSSDKCVIINGTKDECKDPVTAEEEDWDDDNHASLRQDSEEEGDHSEKEDEEEESEDEEEEIEDCSNNER